MVLGGRVAPVKEFYLKKNFELLCFLFLLSSPASPQALSTKPAALELTHVTVIDTTGAPVQADVTIVIRGDRIVGMWKSGKVRVPAGSQVVNADGKFLIPGLWDMDVLWYDPKEYLPLFIVNGVTGVRELLGYAEHYEFRKEIEAGQLLGPRMVIATRWVEGSKQIDPWFISVANEAEARQAVINAQEYGADFIELGSYETLSRDAFFALAEEAKKRGIPIEGHVPVSVSAEEASNAGQRSIEIFDDDVGILAACSSREADLLKSWQEAVAKFFALGEQSDYLSRIPGFGARMQLALETYDQQKAEALFALLRANHTWLSPTLTAGRSSVSFYDPIIVSDPRLKYMPVAARSEWQEANDSRKTRSPEDTAVRKRVYQKDLEIVGAMRRAGVEFLAGTTTEEPLFTVPGFSLHDELALLVQAGLTPMEALQAATLNPARFLGREHDFGTVAAGKIADLVLLDANPLEDISNTRKIAAVVYGGKLFRQYRELKSTQPDSYDFTNKYDLLGVGGQLLDAKKFKEAIQVYELDAEAFPRWWRVYDELGKVYMGAGEEALAIKNFKKSLELDPAQTYAAIKLKQLNSQ